MKTLTNILIAASAVVGVAGLALPASADIVCNSDNQCWHTHRQHYTYKPEFGVVVHPDNWVWGANDHYKWHEHAGRGYWRNGVWITF